MSSYYFFFLCTFFVFQNVTSAYTVEDLFDHRAHLDNSKNMLEDNDFYRMKNGFVNKIFKQAIGYPDPRGGELTFVHKKAIRLAYENGADCNPKINYDGQVIFDDGLKDLAFRHNLLGYLIRHHEILKFRLVCENKLEYLLTKSYVLINEKKPTQNPPVSFIFHPKTLDFLLSFGLDINQIDDRGRNFAMLIHTSIPFFTGNELKEQCILKSKLFQHAQTMIDYFYEQGGNFFVKDNYGNHILHYVIRYGLNFLTKERLTLLAKKFKGSSFSTDFKQKFFLSLVSNESLCYLTQFKTEWKILSVLGISFEELKRQKRELKNLTEDPDQQVRLSKESKEKIEKRKELIARLTAIIYKTRNDFEKSRKRLQLMEHYVEYINFIFNCFLDHGFSVMDQPVDNSVIKYALNTNMLEKNLLNNSTVHALLYHSIITQAATKPIRIIPQNNILFSIIVREKLQNYLMSRDYKKVLHMYKDQAKKKK